MTEASESELTGHYARKLTQEEATKLAKDTVLLSEFKRTETGSRGSEKLGPLLQTDSDLPSDATPVLLEVGCGVGNFAFPLIEEKTSYYIYACDFSPRAVQFVKSHPLYDESAAITAFQCDITKDRLVDRVPTEGVDVVTMIFVLDYGLFDQAMLRFAPGHKIDTNFYVRQDGTRAFYFSEQHLERLFLDAGYEVVSNEYVCRETVNKKEGICVPRIFVQGKFRKPRSKSKETSFNGASS
ncbi:hypothetical protein MTO96_031536 [Rhipicephalus appendiculatus]